QYPVTLTPGSNGNPKSIKLNPHRADSGISLAWVPGLHVAGKAPQELRVILDRYGNVVPVAGERKVPGIRQGCAGGDGERAAPGFARCDRVCGVLRDFKHSGRGAVVMERQDNISFVRLVSQVGLEISRPAGAGAELAQEAIRPVKAQIITSPSG